MFKLAVIAFCAQALVQTAYSQCIPSLGAANLNFVPNININSLGSSNCGLNSLGGSNIALNSLGGSNIALNSLGGPNIGGQTGYGGSGTGEFVAVGELPVTGMTAVDGSVPVYGIVQFNGNIPAGGIVTVLGNTPNICSCSCPGLAY